MDLRQESLSLASRSVVKDLTPSPRVAIACTGNHVVRLWHPKEEMADTCSFAIWRVAVSSHELNADGGMVLVKEGRLRSLVSAWNCTYIRSGIVTMLPPLPGWKARRLVHPSPAGPPALGCNPHRAFGL
jgi:hypothetical protein